MSSLDPANNPCGVRLHELRRHHYGELDAARSKSIHEHAESCDHCSTRLADLRATEAAFAQTHDAAIASAQILAKLEETQRPRFRFLPWLAPIAAVMTAALIAVLVPSEPANRIKGGGTPERSLIGFEMYVNRHEGPSLAQQGIGLTAGDQIQFRYKNAGNRWVLVLSVDGRGVITPLYPADGGASVLIEPSGSHVLEGSIILDDAVGVERVFAFFSQDPLSFEDIRPKVEAQIIAAQGDLKAVSDVDLGEEGEGVEQATFWFLKM